MKTFLINVSIFFPLIFPFVSFAQGGPPLITDDPLTPGPGNWEINIAAAVERSSLVAAWQMPFIDINYGVGEHMQLKVESPFMIEKENNSYLWNGFDEIKFGIKYRFLDAESFGSNISSYPQIQIPLKFEDKAEFFLPVELNKEWSSFGLTAELGHDWIQGHSAGWRGGIAAALFLNHTDVLVEYHSNLQEAPFDICEPMINVGIIWEYSESISFLGSIGKSLHQKNDDTNLWGYIGIQLKL